MKAVTTIEGTIVPLWRSNVDTDQILPKQFLKRITRTGFEDAVFYDWRQDPEFVLNDERYAGGNIFVSGPNFGCGSSREHAPWGLRDFGFKAIIAPSFGDIFRSNCANIGLLLVELPEEVCHGIALAAEQRPGLRGTVDLATLSAEIDGVTHTFPFDATDRARMLAGLDAIGVTLERRDEIEAFESARPMWRPSWRPQNA
jgi:3-isopropylmalate/(R)-2-methylmalate dehydratase small subunit